MLIFGSEGDASPEKEAGFSSFAAVAVLYEQDILRDDRVLIFILIFIFSCIRHITVVELHTNIVDHQ